MTVKFELHGRLAFSSGDDFIVFDPETRELIPYTRDGAFITVDDAYETTFAVMRLDVPKTIKDDPEQLAAYRRYALKGV